MLGSLSGAVVRGESLMPESGMLLKFSSVKDSLNLSVEYKSARSDSAGHFVLEDLRAGVWSVSYQDLGGTWRQFNAHVIADAMTSIEVNSLGPQEAETPGPQDVCDVPQPALPGGVTGQVLDGRTGRPVEDAAITIVRAAGPFPDIAPLTDANGRFALGDLPTGSWGVQALGPDGRIGGVDVTVPSGRTVDVRIHLGDA